MTVNEELGTQVTQYNDLKMGSNLAYQNVSSCILNKHVSFHTIFKRRVCSRGAGAANARILGKKQTKIKHWSFTVKEFCCHLLDELVNDYFYFNFIEVVVKKMAVDPASFLNPNKKNKL